MRDEEFDEAVSWYAEYLGLGDSGNAPPFEQWLAGTPPGLREHLTRVHDDRLRIDSVIERTTKGVRQPQFVEAPEPVFVRDESDARAPLADDPLVGHLPAYGDEGRKLGKCVLRRMLGKGAYGRVYLARHLDFDCDVAVKCLDRLRVDQGDIQIDRFRNEARIAVRVTHQNLIRIHDLGEEAGLHYIVMEYIAGDDLGAKLRQTPAGRLSSSEVWPIARAIAAAVAALHQRGIVHRDIKPANILVGTAGELKLADLGLAKGQDSPNLTLSEHPMGSYFYMSPESFANGKRASRASDIWSLGATLVHLLLGRPGLVGQTPDFGQVAAALTSAGHPRVATLVPDCDARLASILDRCLEFEPKKRFQDAEELVAALEARSSDSSTLDPPGRPRSKRVLGAVAIIAAACFAVRHHAPRSPEADPASMDGRIPKPPSVVITSESSSFNEAIALRNRREFAAAIARLESCTSEPEGRSALADTWFAWALEAEDRRSYALAAERHARAREFGHAAASERLVHCRLLRARELQSADRLDDALLETRAAASVADTADVAAIAAELTTAIRDELESRLTVEPASGARIAAREAALAIRCANATSFEIDHVALSPDLDGTARTTLRRDVDGEATITITVASRAGVTYERSFTYRFDATPPGLVAEFEARPAEATAIAVFDATGAPNGLLVHDSSLEAIDDVAKLSFRDRGILTGRVDDPTATLRVDDQPVSLATDGSFRLELPIRSDLEATLVANDGVHETPRRVRFVTPRILENVIAQRDSGRIRFFSSIEPTLELVFIPQHQDASGEVLPAFFMSRLEIANASYARHAAPPEFVDSVAIASHFISSRPDAPDRMCAGLAEYLERYPDYPVIGVTWTEARTFAQRLGGDLPTMEQFRFAAAGPRNRPFAFHTDLPPPDHKEANWSGYFAIEGEWGATPENTWRLLGTSDEVNSRYSADGYLRTAPCDHSQYPPGPFGTKQQAGNVEEWLLEGPADSNEQRYSAGGDYASTFSALRTTSRIARNLGARSLSRGFRIVVDLRAK